MDRELVACYIEKLDEMLPHMVRRMHHELAQCLQLGITANQFIVMKMIAGRGRMTVSEVAEAINVSLSAVTSLVERLHRAGMIERHRSRDDRRVVWLVLTEKGAEVVDMCKAGRQRIIQRYIGCLEEKEIKFLIEIYEKVVAMMRQEDTRAGEFKS